MVSWDLMVINPLVMTIAMENMTHLTDDFPSKTFIDNGFAMAMLSNRMVGV